MNESANLSMWLLPMTLGGYALGAVLPLLLSVTWSSRRPAGMRRLRLAKDLGFLIALAASLSGCALSLSIVFSGHPLDVAFPQTLPFGPVALHGDELSAFFTGVICLLGAVVSVYSLGYTEEVIGRKSIGYLLFLYNLFLLSMVVVVLAGHAVLFLLAWEAMSLATYFLINFEHRDAAARRAGFQYVVMTHVGTTFIVVMFLLLYSHTGSFSFESFRDAGPGLSAPVRSLVFLAALVGFGVKAGVMPFHIWLPEAHPAAPTNVSALMSGVMIKTGIYGMVRVFFDFVGSGIPEWWGLLVLVLAVTSSVLGVLYALTEHDMKRLLAFHSIENIGIILMGVGGALLFASFGEKSLAAVALIAALYHVLNHATFKGLLFLGAGSILHATHSKNIEELGGLIRKLPMTAVFFLIGAVAISGLPPLNGFVSEWLTFQALLLGFHIPDLAVKIALPLTVAFLALTGALAAACFVKAFGITFLGLARSREAEHAIESPPSMLVAMGVLALLCVVFGVVPGMVLDVLNPLASSLVRWDVAAPVTFDDGFLSIPQGAASAISPGALTGVLLAVMLIPVIAGYLVGGRLRSRIAMTWACGLPKIDPRMQYTATGFSKPIRMIFSSIYRATHEIGISEEASPYFHPRIRYELRTESVFLKYMYEPLYAALVSSARLVRRIQTGHIQSYLAYIFITLVLLLLFAR